MLFPAAVTFLGCFGLYYIILLKTRLSLLERALLFFASCTLAIGGALIVLSSFSVEREDLLFIALLTLPLSLLFSLATWWREWATVKRVLKSEALTQAAKGKIFFYHKESNWKPVVMIVGRIKEIEES